MDYNEAFNFLTDFSSREDASFGECLDAYRKMEDMIFAHPSLQDMIFETLKKSTQYKGFCSDTIPAAHNVWSKIIAMSSSQKAVSMFNEMFETNPEFAIKYPSELLDRKKELTQTMFTQAFSKVDDLNANSMYAYSNAIESAICHAGTDEAREWLNLAMAKEGFNQPIYSALDKIYDAHSELGPGLIYINEKYQHLSPHRFFSNAAHIAVLNPIVDENTGYVADDLVINDQVREYAVDMIEAGIASPDIDASALVAAYKACGQIIDYFPQYCDRMTAAILKGLENPKNTRGSQKAAYRVLKDYERLSSTVSFHQRVAKNDENKFGMKKTDDIDLNKPCIVIFGGDGVLIDQRLNGYMGEAYRLLEEYKLQDKVNVYGVLYDFGEYMNTNHARVHLMERYGRNISSRHIESASERRSKILKEMTEDSKNPKYIKDIFNKFVLPRLADKDGKRYDTETAAQYIRMMTTIGHCHGGYTILMLEEMMQQKMTELGYTPEERKYIQKQLLAVAQSPYCPLGVSKSTMISFFSASDDEINHDNYFHNAMEDIRKKEHIPLSYFPGKQGNVFIVHSMGKECDEHNYWRLALDEKISKEGQALILFERKAIINGIKNALRGTPLPETEDLIADDEASRSLFEQAKKNGKELYAKIHSTSLAIAKKLRSKDK